MTFRLSGTDKSKPTRSSLLTLVTRHTMNKEMRDCRVCGAPSIGLNFGVQTCESCKAFFRRNALRERLPPCALQPNGQRCRITKITRKFCPPCRLDKCLSVGMEKSSILVGSQLKEKQRQYKSIEAKTQHRKERGGGDLETRDSVMERILTRRPAAGESELINKMAMQLYRQCQCACTCGVFDQLTPVPTIVDHVCLELLKSPSSSHHHNNMLPSVSVSPAVTISPTPTKFELYYDKSTIADMLLDEEAQESLPSVIKSLNVDPHVWGVIDDNTMHEIRIAAQAIMVNIGDDLPASIPEEVQVVAIMDRCTRRLIEMAKKIQAFKELIPEDQRSLLKGGCIEMGVLRGAMTYDCEAEQFTKLDGRDSFDVPIDLLKSVSQTSNVYEEHRLFLQTFDPTMLADETVMLLLIVITMFNSKRPHLINTQQVERQANLYREMLQKHLRRAYTSKGHAKYLFKTLEGKLSQLTALNGSAHHFFDRVDERAIGPLLMEIFELAHPRSRFGVHK